MLSPEEQIPVELQIPVRVAAELFDRSSRLKAYLARIGFGDSNELVRLISAMQRALENLERKTIESLAQPWQELPDEVERRAAIDTLWSTLGKFSGEFATIHETLVLLPGERVSPELGFTLQRSFGDLFTEYMPSTVLGSIFNAFEFDLVKIWKQRLVDITDIFLPGEEIVVLQLAICETDSPLAYAVLGHELGHAIDSRHQISDTIAPEVVPDPDTDLFGTVKKWCGELCADIVAARAMGPAPLLSLLSMEYCFHPRRNLWALRERDPTNPSRLRVVTHPMSRARFGVVLEELRGSLDGDLIDPEAQFYESACDINLERWYPNEPDRQAQKRSQDTLTEGLIRRMVERVREELSKLSLSMPTVDLRKQSVMRCVDRLRSGSPVSAQGDPRTSLHPKVQLFRQLFSQQCLDCPEGPRVAFETLCAELATTVPPIPDDPQEARGQAFHMLSRECAESPLDIPKILFSGYLRRSQRITKLFREKQPLSTRKLVDSLCDSLAVLDRLIRNSIMTSWVHQRVLDRLRAPKQERAHV